MLNRLKGHIKGNLAGVPEITFRIWKKDYGRNIMPLEDPSIKEYIRSSFIAGRAQCPMGCKTFEESLVLLDCNSMYPFVLGSFDYPSHKFKVAENIEGEDIKMGIYTCDVDQSEIRGMAIIPYPGRTYDWNNKSFQENIILT